MQSRIAQLVLAELFAFGVFVCGGLALLGGSVTQAGDSPHPLPLSWALVAAFSCVAVVLAKSAALRLKQVVSRSGE